MNKYIEIKIKKLYLVIFAVILVFACSIGIYHDWCAYHPDVRILIGDGGTGKEGINIQAPHIAIAGRGIAEPAAAIYLKINNVVMKHEFFLIYIKDTYQTSDIELDMGVKDNVTFLKYYGTATTIDGDIVDIEKEIVCDFLLEADIESNS